MQLEKIYQKLIDTMPNYKVRHSQLEMANIIDECFHNANPENEDGSNIVLVEAPTGTGKSMAYLLAGIVNAKRLGKKLVITTATKALQSQLVEKDIPNMVAHTGVKFTYTLAKGRNNYLCPYQLDLALNDLTTDLLLESNSLKEELKEIRAAFSHKGWDGDLDLLPFATDYKVRAIITTDKERCLSTSCPYNQENECKCPFYLNRAKLKFSEVIVTNHSLLLADLSVGAGSVLAIQPKDYLLCIDEGHNLPDVAIRSFSQKFELKQIIGVCQNLMHLVMNPDNQSYVFADIPLCEGIYDKVSTLVANLDQLLQLLNQNLEQFKEDKLILNDYLNTSLNSIFRDQFVNFAYLTFEINKGLSIIVEKLKAQIKETPDVLIETNLNKLGFYVTAIDGVLNTSQYIINQDDSRYNANAKWIELKSIKNSTHDFVINACVTHVGKKLFDTLWSKVYAVVITSATLAIGNDFSYNKFKLGLNLLESVASQKLDSTFDYARQAQIAVPRFRNSPEYNSRENFATELLEYLSKNLDYEAGYGTLVLFFNRKQLVDTYDKLPKRLQKIILSQENYISNGRLIHDHKKRIDAGVPSIIFGLNSFAEGVDLPGLYCCHVIITKLPFETHKDPESMVLEYWVRYEKGNYFAEVSLPEASIRLIQASGRLIRSDKDYGQVSICDNRLVTKDYGRVMLDALPQFNRKYDENFLNKAFMKMNENGAN